MDQIRSTANPRRVNWYGSNFTQEQWMSKIKEVIDSLDDSLEISDPLFAEKLGYKAPLGGLIAIHEFVLDALGYDYMYLKKNIEIDGQYVIRKFIKFIPRKESYASKRIKSKEKLTAYVTKALDDNNGQLDMRLMKFLNAVSLSRSCGAVLHYQQAVLESLNIDWAIYKGTVKRIKLWYKETESPDLMNVKAEELSIDDAVYTALASFVTEIKKYSNSKYQSKIKSLQVQVRALDKHVTTSEIEIDALKKELLELKDKGKKVKSHGSLFNRLFS